MIPHRPPPAFVRVKTPPITCPVCGKQEANVQHFCTKCWFELPAGERQQLAAMTRRGLQTDAKVAKLTQILKDRRPAGWAVLGLAENQTAAERIATLQKAANNVLNAFDHP